MIVVPLKNDKIETLDGGTFIVMSYTNLKSEPAVYIDAKPGENSVVYFQDITSINNVKVKYDVNNKVFEALGTIRRKFNLPQEKDVLGVAPSETSDNNSHVVKSIKLHNKKEGVTRGLLVCDDNVCYELTSIQNVERSDGSERFSAGEFIRYYEDYLPMNYRK